MSKIQLPPLPEYARGPIIDGIQYKSPSLNKLQLQAIQREAAIWALEEAEKVCERLSVQYRDEYKGRTTPINRDRLYNPHTDGLSDGCGQCEDAIRALKEQIDD